MRLLLRISNPFPQTHDRLKNKKYKKYFNFFYVVKTIINHDSQ